MFLNVTAHEAVLSGSAGELSAAGHRIGELRPGEKLELPVSLKSGLLHEQGAKVVVIAAANTTFMAQQDGKRLMIEGSPASLQAFAEHFSFNCEPIPGVHSHWDLGGISDLVNPESLPIVVQIA